MVRHSRGKYAGAVADFTEALLLDPNDKHAKKLKEHSAAKVQEVRLTSTPFLNNLFFGSWFSNRLTKLIAKPLLHRHVQEMMRDTLAPIDSTVVLDGRISTRD